MHTYTTFAKFIGSEHIYTYAKVKSGKICARYYSWYL